MRRQVRRSWETCVTRRRDDAPDASWSRLGSAHLKAAPQLRTTLRLGRTLGRESPAGPGGSGPFPVRLVTGAFLPRTVDSEKPCFACGPMGPQPLDRESGLGTARTPCGDPHVGLADLTFRRSTEPADLHQGGIDRLRERPASLKKRGFPPATGAASRGRSHGPRCPDHLPSASPAHGAPAPPRVNSFPQGPHRPGGLIGLMREFVASTLSRTGDMMIKNRDAFQ